MRGGVRRRDLTWRPIGRKHPVIAGLDLTVEPGERVLLVGPSGAGKSSILHALAAAFEAVYEWTGYYSYWDMDYKLAHLGFFVVSGVVVAGLGGYALVRALARAGVLDAFGAGREQATEV